MAIQKAITFRGIPLPESYTHIYTLSHDRQRDASLLFVRTYANAAARLSGEEGIAQAVYSLPYTPQEGIAWAYNQLKQLPEFAGAVDV